jgi:hypothetical protein
MAVAIKATATLSYYPAIKRFSDWRRPGIELHCRLCGEPFLIYFGPEMTESEARRWFYYRSGQDHPHMADGFAAHEVFPILEEELAS